MKIANIKKIKKNLSIVYFEDESFKYIHNETIMRYSLCKDVTLGEDIIEEIIYNSDYKRAKEKAVNLIAYKTRTKKELKEKLRQNFSGEIVELVIERMEDIGLINDREYANRVAHNLVYNKHMSYRGVKYKLIEKGFSSTLIEEIISKLEIDPHEQITALLEGKYSRKLYTENSRQKVFSSLLRMGFNWYDIKDVMENYTDDDEE